MPGVVLSHNSRWPPAVLRAHEAAERQRGAPIRNLQLVRLGLLVHPGQPLKVVEADLGAWPGGGVSVPGVRIPAPVTARRMVEAAWSPTVPAT